MHSCARTQRFVLYVVFCGVTVSMHVHVQVDKNQFDPTNTMSRRIAHLREIRTVNREA